MNCYLATSSTTVRHVQSTHELEQLYRTNGRKITPQRRAVFTVLQNNSSHPTAEQIHADVESLIGPVSLRTVYSVLNELAELGEILHHDLGTGSTRFDPNSTAHHHVVCTSCGNIDDVDVTQAGVRPCGENANGFQTTGTEIVFRGVCATCALTETTTAS